MLAGCAPSTQYIAPARESVANESALDQRYAKYGAYYLVAETRMEFSDQMVTLAGGNSSRGEVVVFKRLKVLNSESSEYGTIKIDSYSDYISLFKVSLSTPEGGTSELEVEKLQAEYVKTGKIAVPHVKAGTVVTIEIHFSTGRVLPFFEVWMSGNLPVAHSIFTLSTLGSYTFDAKEYSGLGKPRIDTVKNGLSTFLVRNWSMDGVLPRSRVGMKASMDRSEPRVSAVLRHYGWQDIFTDWKKLSESYQKELLKKSVFAGDGRVKKLADSLAGAFGNAKYDSAFAWVQRNLRIKRHPLGPIFPNDVIDSREGNVWEIAVVLRDVLEAMGARCDIVVTRPRFMGGFDSSFITPSVLALPLVIVMEPGPKRVAYPFGKGAALGEYSTEYFGLEALSMNTLDIQSLPPSTSPSSNSYYRFTLHTADPNGRAELSLDWQGYWAYYFRSTLSTLKHDEVGEVFQRFLGGISKANVLDSFQVEGIQIPGSPLSAHVYFHNSEAMIEHKGEKLLRLDHVFDRYFTTWDSSRISEVSLHVPETIREEVIVDGDAPVRIDFTCRDVSTEVFIQTCSQEGVSSLRRKLQVKSGDFSPDVARRLLPEIEKLNEIRNSSMVVK